VVRIPRDLLGEPEVTLGVIRVYAALRQRVGFEPAAENYLICWPSVATTARDAGLHRATVIQAIAWLAQRDYVIVQRNPRRASSYLVVPWRAQYRRIIVERGRAEAIRWLLSERNHLAEESRSGQAEAADLRRGFELPPRWLERSADPGDRQLAREMREADNKRRPAPPGARKSPGGDRNDGAGHYGSPGDDMGSRRETTSPVARRRPRTVVQENCVSGNRGATDVAPSPALEEQQKTALKEIERAISPAVRRMPSSRPMSSEEREARIQVLRHQVKDWRS
jgi:hypothetical protein